MYQHKSAPNSCRTEDCTALPSTGSPHWSWNHLPLISSSLHCDKIIQNCTLENYTRRNQHTTTNLYQLVATQWIVQRCHPRKVFSEAEFTLKISENFHHVKLYGNVPMRAILGEISAPPQIYTVKMFAQRCHPREPPPPEAKITFQN